MFTLSKPAAKEMADGSRPVWSWLAPLSLFVLALGLLFFRLGSPGLINICESFYPASVREMIEANSYIVPQLNYQIYFSKPIMTFWLMAASYHAFGLNDFAGRFAQALLTLALTMYCYFVGNKLQGRLTGFLAGAFLASSPFLLIYTRASSIDAFFTVFLGISLCSLLAVVSGGSKRQWPLIYIALALAVLTKGPAAIVLFGGGCVLSLLFIRPTFDQLKATARQLHLVAGSLLFLAVMLPWWIAVGIQTNWLFPEVFVLYENISRYLGHATLRPHYWWRYLVVIAIGLLPWSLYLPAAIFDTLKNKLNLHARNIDTKESLLDPRTICVGFALAIIVFFSLSSTQMETYVMPACTPLALAAALSLTQWLKEENSFGKKWLNGVSIALVAFGAIALIGGILTPCFFKALVPWATIGIPIVGVILGFAVYWQRKLFKSGQIEKSLTVIAASMCIFSTVLIPTCIEQWYNDTQKELHDLTRSLKKTPEQVCLYMNYLPALMYYTEGPVDCFFNAAQIVPKKPGSPKLYLLARKTEAKMLTVLNPQVTLHPMSLGDRWGLYYIPNGTLLKGCSLDKIFKTLSIRDMLFLDHRKYGMLTDYYNGGDLNLPARFNK